MFRRTTLMAAVTALTLGLVATPAGADPAPASAPNDFTIIVLPDTQYGAKNCPRQFHEQTRWIKRKEKARNIRYVVHVGDIVGNARKPKQWRVATKAMYRLDGHVPYLMTVGNHDFDDLPKGDNADHSTKFFNKHFPRKKFASRLAFGGSFPKKRNDNSYHVFSAGGTRWLALSLKYDPTKKAVAWANKVIKNHPRRQVMIVTHSYQKGDKLNDHGKRLWRNLVRKHENVSFVFSGHHVAAGMITSKGDHGNTVYQIQADYQDKKRCRPNGFLRIMKFRPADNAISVRTFSPAARKNPYKTGPRNQFTIKNVPFI